MCGARNRRPGTSGPTWQGCRGAVPGGEPRTVRRTAVLALTAAFFGALSAAVFVGIVRATASPHATHGAHLPRVDSTLPSWLPPRGAARGGGLPRGGSP